MSIADYKYAVNVAVAGLLHSMHVDDVLKRSTRVESTVDWLCCAQDSKAVD